MKKTADYHRLRRPSDEVTPPPARAARTRGPSPKQTAWYWREWAAAKAVLVSSGGYTRTEAEGQRMEIHMATLGSAVSSKSLTNEQLDRIIAAFRAISRPDDLPSQLAGSTGPRRRLMHGIRTIVQGREDYIATICADIYGHRDWTRLTDAELEKLRWTLERRFVRNPRS